MTFWEHHSGKVILELLANFKSQLPSVGQRKRKRNERTTRRFTLSNFKIRHLQSTHCTLGTVLSKHILYLHFIANIRHEHMLVFFR